MAWWKFGRGAKQSETRALARARQKRMYAAARASRLTADWAASSASADAEIKSSLSRMRARSRQLERDNDYVANFYREVESNVVGRGIPFQSQVKMNRGGKLNQRLNDEIEEKWENWCDMNRCHVGGKLGFVDIERLVIRSIARDGDIGVRMIRQTFGDSRVPFALEIIEADQVDDDYQDVLENGRTVRFGVELDQWMRPTAYYVKPHPGDYQFTPPGGIRGRRVRIPAEEMIVPFLSTRTNQTRGVPWIVSAMSRLHQMGGYEEAEVIGARAGSMILGFIETPDGQVQGDEVVDGEQITDFENGVIKALGPGQKMNIPDTRKPNAGFDPFMRAMLRGVAAGTGTSYEAISKDYSQSNYSSSRMALLSERDNWRVIQDWFIRNFHKKVFAAWLDMAVLANEIAIPDYEMNRDRYLKVRWMPRGWAWIDPTKEVSAFKDAVRSGFTTLSNVVAQQGDDFEELMSQRKRELELLDDEGIVLDTDPSQVTEAGMAQMTGTGGGGASEKPVDDPKAD